MAQEKAIGRTYVLHGEMIAAGEHFERAVRLAQDPQVRAHLHSLAAASLVTTGDQRGLDHLREALAVLDPKVNPLGTANAIAIEGRFHHLAGRHKKAIDLLERAASLVAPIAERDSVTQFAASIIPRIYGYIAGAYQHYGRFLDADRWAQVAVDFGVKHNVLFAQALGLEYLGEDAVYSGDFVAGIEYAEREREIAATLHSRERRGWTHYIAAQCAFYSGDPAGAEREFVEGIALAESIGELRLASLLKGSFAVLRADQASDCRARGVSHGYGAPAPTGSGIDRVDPQRLLDEALQIALDNFQAGETSGLLYSRFEGRRCLAAAHFRRGEFDEAERLCAEASELVSGTDSRLSRLWLGPLFIETLLAAGLRAEGDGAPDEAAAKLGLAAEHLAAYQELVAECQSPRFTREAARLADLIASSFKAF
jgi:tetratricopeptide (TPR) repeat protein